MLAGINPSSVVLLNRLTVIFKVEGAQKTLSAAEASPYRTEWKKNYLYHSLMGDIYAGSDTSLAKTFYETAARLTKSEAEKKLLQKKMEHLGGG